MSFTVIYHPAVKDDAAAISKEIRDRIKSAIEIRLTSEPAKHGKPLGQYASWILEATGRGLACGVRHLRQRGSRVCHQAPQQVYDEVSERL